MRHLPVHREGAYRTLKVCITCRNAKNELAVSNLIKSVDPGEHPGKERLRVALDDFQIQGPSGSHQCLIFDPLGWNFANYRFAFEGDGGFDLLRRSLLLILAGLDFLHQIGVVHTGMFPIP